MSVQPSSQASQAVQQQQPPAPTPRALAVARYLRHNPTLKNKSAVVGGKRVNYFRVKRALRALMSEEYAKKRKDPLPEIKTKEEAVKTLAQLPLHFLALRVERVSHQGHEHSKKKTNVGPEMEIQREQHFMDEMHYAWFWDEPQTRTYLLAMVMVLILLAGVMFPLWPASMRRGAWYLSMVGVAFIVFLLVTAVVRLIFYIITFFAAKPGIWVFPNLFEDVGFFESFVPLYAWDTKVSACRLSVNMKVKKKKTRKATEGSEKVIQSEPVQGATVTTNAIKQRSLQSQSEQR